MLWLGAPTSCFTANVVESRSRKESVELNFRFLGITANLHGPSFPCFVARIITFWFPFYWQGFLRCRPDRSLIWSLAQ